MDMLRFLYISACLMIVSNANQDHTEKLFYKAASTRANVGTF